MKSPIVQTDSTVVLVGGGACDPVVLAAAMAAAEVVVAADGGADRVLAAGRMPDAVYGDLDSLSAQARGRLSPGVLRPVAEQDSTDFDKCLRHIEAPLVLGYGFLGARLDHELAAMHVLVARAAQRCLLVGEVDVVCLCPPRLEIDLPPGLRFSLFPMGAVGGRSEGLRWPVDGLAFSPAAMIGTSNEVTGPVRLDMDAPGMLLILPVETLVPLSQALMAAEVWPQV